VADRQAAGDFSFGDPLLPIELVDSAGVVRASASVSDTNPGVALAIVDPPRRSSV
jgi:hypothetical protein